VDVLDDIVFDAPIQHRTISENGGEAGTQCRINRPIKSDSDLLKSGVQTRHASGLNGYVHLEQLAVIGTRPEPLVLSGVDCCVIILIVSVPCRRKAISRGPPTMISSSSN
jgi:hypothetical protein